MTTWLLVALSSASVGLAAGLLSKRWWSGAAISTLLPSMAAQTWILVEEFLLPYRGGGASLWPIALVVATAVTAGIGFSAFVLTVGARASLRRTDANGASEVVGSWPRDA